MKIAVVGVGGVGGYFGGRLAQSGVDTTFIARGATLEALRTRGLRVDSTHGDFVLERVNATDDPNSVGPVDAILMTVKAWQIEDAAATLAPMIGPDTVVVPLENGVDAPDVLQRIFGPEHVAGGLCAIVSFIAAPGHIKHVAYDPLVVFGELDNRRSERLERLRDAFLRAKVKADVPQDIHHSMWTKFLFIATYSGIGAVTRAPIGVWRAIPEIREIVDASLHEVVAVAHARGVDLGADAVAKTWERYDAMPAPSTSSMQRDILEGKPSELDAQLGAIVRLAREHGVAAPATSFIYHCLLPQERAARRA
ncbi:MAG TPA: 2-dehydropantoate 2-reductase [Thermoanaerobaculia bacterium]|jgi:2-dehydropantoate 2-reductase